MWYPLWCHTLTDLISDLPNVIVAPQYPLYVTQDEKTATRARIKAEESDGETPDSDNIAPPAAENEINDMAADNDDIEEDDSSMSTTSTHAKTGIDSAIVDYAIVHIVVQPVEFPQSQVRASEVIPTQVLQGTR